ncbi:MAG TPA: tetratricopeptide repeat protein [Gallionella sp.]|nr:tetratricopeptide repeat protein [Gallionella sp.]
MNIFNYLARLVAVLAGALLICASLTALADEMDDANSLFKQGQRSEALDKVNVYLNDKPKDARARFLKGLILTDQGKTAAAIKIFAALTVDYPDLPEPYNNLAVLYAGQGQYDKAKELLEKAISTHPSYATAHENLGDIYAKMASQAYDRALQLDQGNTATQTKLAMIQNLFATGAPGKEPPAQIAPAPSRPETAPVTAAAAQPEPDQPASAVVAIDRKSESETEPVAVPERAAKKDSSKEVEETVMAWAAAWSAQDVNKYLSFYADDFKTPDGETRAAWEVIRKERISAPKYIEVGIRIATIQFTDSDHATVRFRQSYRASHLNASGNKTLLMVKSGDKWLIQEERSR